MILINEFRYMFHFFRIFPISVALQHQNAPNIVPTNAPQNAQYFMPPYAQYGHMSYMPNRFPSMVHVPHAPVFDAPPLRTSHSWPRGHLPPFNPFDAPPSIKHDHYYYGYERNAGYDGSFTPNPILCPPNASLVQQYEPEQTWNAPDDHQMMPVSDVHGDYYQPTTDTPDQSMSLERVPQRSTEAAAVHENVPQSVHADSPKLDTANTKKKIPRPMNSFMIYAKVHRAQVHVVYPMCDNRTASKILSESWYALDANIKQKYHDLAVEMRREHYRMFPEYKWRSDLADLKRPPGKSPTEQSDDQKSLASESDLSLQTEAIQIVEKSEWTRPDVPITPSPNEASPGTVSNIDTVLRFSHEPFALESQFQLGPTPAQLAQKKDRKATRGDRIDAVDIPAVTNNPHLKQLFRELPIFDFSTYRAEKGWESPSPPAMTYNKSNRKRATKQPDGVPAKRLVGERFFGPDFDVNTFKGNLKYI